MTDGHYTKYSEYYDIDITKTASLSGSTSPQFGYKYVHQNPNLDPITNSPYISLINVHANRYEHNESIPLGKPFVSNIHPSTPVTKDTSHLLWTFHIFPTEELKDNSITPATILTILANDDASRFNTSLNEKNVSIISVYKLMAEQTVLLQTTVTVCIYTGT